MDFKESRFGPLTEKNTLNVRRNPVCQFRRCQYAGDVGVVQGGEKFFPINEEGYSTFLIPIPVFDEPVPVVADTTAMSVPHEIDYELTFVMSGVVSQNATPRAAAQRMVYMVFVIIAICGVVSYINKRRRNSVK